MIGYAYEFHQSDSDREFIIVPKKDDFSAIPKWITDRVGTAAPFRELHLGTAAGLPGMTGRDLKTEIDMSDYAVVQAQFELRRRIN